MIKDKELKEFLAWAKELDFDVTNEALRDEAVRLLPQVATDLINERTLRRKLLYQLDQRAAFVSELVKEHRQYEKELENGTNTWIDPATKS